MLLLVHCEVLHDTFHHVEICAIGARINGIVPPGEIVIMSTSNSEEKSVTPELNEAVQKLCDEEVQTVNEYYGTDITKITAKEDEEVEGHVRAKYIKTGQTVIHHKNEKDFIYTRSKSFSFTNEVKKSRMVRDVQVKPLEVVIRWEDDPFVWEVFSRDFLFKLA